MGSGALIMNEKMMIAMILIMINGLRLNDTARPCVIRSGPGMTGQLRQRKFFPRSSGFKSALGINREYLAHDVKTTAPTVIDQIINCCKS